MYTYERKSFVGREVAMLYKVGKFWLFLEGISVVVKVDVNRNLAIPPFGSCNTECSLTRLESHACDNY